MVLSRAYYHKPGHFVAAAVVLSVLAILAAAFRFWARLKHKQGLRADDWYILSAAVCAVLGKAQIKKKKAKLTYR